MANFVAGLILGGGAVFVIGVVALRFFSQAIDNAELDEGH